MNNKIILVLLFILGFFCESFAQKQKDYVRFSTANKDINDICFSKSGGVLAIPDGASIRVYSTVDYKLIYDFSDGHSDKILALKISNDSSLLVSGGKDSTVAIWDFLQRKLTGKLKYNNGIITTVGISPDSKFLASGSTEGKVSVYDIINKKTVFDFDKRANCITALEFSPDGKFLAVAGADGLLNLYDMNNGQLLTSLKAHKSWARDISFNDIQTKLITCGDDSKIKIWDISDINRIRLEDEENNGGLAWVISLDYCSDNSTYVTGDVAGNIKIVLNYGFYHASVGKPINKILIMPNDKIYLKVAVATRGKGVLLMEATDMKSKK